MTEILREICLANGCVWAATSAGGEGTGGEHMPPKGTLFCASGKDPQVVLSEKGCTAATIEGPFARLHGGDYFFGTMRAVGFTANEDPRQKPPNHPLFQD